MDSLPSTVITTEMIKRVCVKLGFYRNPICNEKLYLHHKGFDSIEEDAFDPYTDVKVLWLESNAFTYIPCGKDSVPRQKTLPKSGVQADELIPLATTGCSKSAQLERIKKSQLDCPCGCVETPRDAASHVEEQESDRTRSATNEDVLPAKETREDGSTSTATAACLTESAKKDVFQSLYPTLRQLYLHNNILREMPDLSGFQRLDTVNLSNNSIHSVQAYCPAFAERKSRYKETLENKKYVFLTNSKSMQHELSASETGGKTNVKEEPQCGQEGDGGDCDNTVKQDSVQPLEITRSTTTATSRRGSHDDMPGAEDLNTWRQRLSDYADFCPHEPLEVAENGKISDDVPPERRNPCSSIRSLNLANNYLANVADIVELLCFKNLSALDLSNNQLSDGEAVLLVLGRLSRLRSLKLSGNPFVRFLPRYRKRVLACCQGLLHLDERPVFADERRLVTAWVRGGDTEENKERMLIKMELENLHTRRFEEFRAMVNRSSRSRLGGDDSNSLAEGDYAARRVARELQRLGMGRRRHDGGSHHHSISSDDDDVTSSDDEEDDEHGGRDESDNNHRRGSAHLSRRMGGRSLRERHAQSWMASDRISSNTPNAQLTSTGGHPPTPQNNIQQQQQQQQQRPEDEDEETDSIYIPSTPS